MGDVIEVIACVIAFYLSKPNPHHIGKPVIEIIACVIAFYLPKPHLLSGAAVRRVDLVVLALAAEASGRTDRRGALSSGGTQA